jgi:hypothetical protein
MTDAAAVSPRTQSPAAHALRRTTKAGRCLKFIADHRMVVFGPSREKSAATDRRPPQRVVLPEKVKRESLFFLRSFLAIVAKFFAPQKSKDFQSVTMMGQVVHDLIRQSRLHVNKMDISPGVNERALRFLSDNIEELFLPRTEQESCVSRLRDTLGEHADALPEGVVSLSAATIEGSRRNFRGLGFQRLAMSLGAGKLEEKLFEACGRIDEEFSPRSQRRWRRSFSCWLLGAVCLPDPGAVLNARFSEVTALEKLACGVTSFPVFCLALQLCALWCEQHPDKQCMPPVVKQIRRMVDELPPLDQNVDCEDTSSQASLFFLALSMLPLLQIPPPSFNSLVAWGKWPVKRTSLSLVGAVRDFLLLAEAEYRFVKATRLGRDVVRELLEGLQMRTEKIRDLCSVSVVDKLLQLDTTSVEQFRLWEMWPPRCSTVSALDRHLKVLLDMKPLVTQLGDASSGESEQQLRKTISAFQQKEAHIASALVQLEDAGAAGAGRLCAGMRGSDSVSGEYQAVDAAEAVTVPEGANFVRGAPPMFPPPSQNPTNTRCLVAATDGSALESDSGMFMGSMSAQVGLVPPPTMDLACMRGDPSTVEWTRDVALIEQDRSLADESDCWPNAGDIGSGPSDDLDPSAWWESAAPSALHPTSFLSQSPLPLASPLVGELSELASPQSLGEVAIPDWGASQPSVSTEAPLRSTAEGAGEIGVEDQSTQDQAEHECVGFGPSAGAAVSGANCAMPATDGSVAFEAVADSTAPRRSCAHRTPQGVQGRILELQAENAALREEIKANRRTQQQQAAEIALLKENRREDQEEGPVARFLRSVYELGKLSPGQLDEALSRRPGANTIREAVEKLVEAPRRDKFGSRTSAKHAR